MLSSWQDWRPEDDLPWFILDAVAQMNTTLLYDPTIEFQQQAHKHRILCRERWRDSVQEPG